MIMRKLKLTAKKSVLSKALRKPLFFNLSQILYPPRQQQENIAVPVFPYSNPIRLILFYFFVFILVIGSYPI